MHTYFWIRTVCKRTFETRWNLAVDTKHCESDKKSWKYDTFSISWHFLRIMQWDLSFKILVITESKFYVTVRRIQVIYVVPQKNVRKPLKQFFSFLDRIITVFSKIGVINGLLCKICSHKSEEGSWSKWQVWLIENQTKRRQNWHNHLSKLAPGSGDEENYY